jgi:hypothetical protein
MNEKRRPMTTTPRAFSPTIHVTRRDTLSAVLVFLLTLIALGAGYALRVSVENRTASYTTEQGITIDYPDTWVIDQAVADGAVARVRDVGAAGAPTTFEVRVQPVDAAADPQTTMAAVANDLALARARDFPAFKLIEIQDDQQLKDLPGTKSRYVFVQTPADIFGASLPTVVLGEDYLVHQGPNVYIFTLHVAEHNYARASQHFERFVAATKLP